MGFFTEFEGPPEKNQVVFLLNRLSNDFIEQRFEKFLNQFNEMLDPKNEEMYTYLNFFGIREDLERKERQYQALRNRVRVAKLVDRFAELTGASSHFGEEEWRVKGYSARKIFGDDVFYTNAFRSEFIEAAKKDGRLVKIEHLIWFVDQKLAEKQPNPANPEDTNDFLWMARRRGLELINWKVLRENERPYDNLGNYIEGTRLEIDLGNGSVSVKRESKPALRIFMERSGSGVMILDKDREGLDDVGWGLVDVVETINVSSAEDLLKNSNDILNQLFEVKQKQKRIYPQHPPIRMEIRGSGVEVNVWEAAQDQAGWKIPFKYKNQLADNYNVKFKTKKERLPDGSIDKHITIEFLIKEWTSGNKRFEPSRGAVVERYRMQPPYNGKLISAEVLYTENTKKISLTLTSGKIEVGIVSSGPNVFIEDEPFALIYTDGQKRYMIVDEDGDGKYEKRRELVAKDYKTGEYRTDVSSEEENNPY